MAAGFLFAIVVLGTWLLPRLLKLVLTWGSRELFLVSIVAVGVGVGYATHSVGLSFALGAFVAGLVLSESELSHQALSDVVPLRDIFGLLFFVTVGMLLDPRFVLPHLGLVALISVAYFPWQSADPGRAGERIWLREYGSLDYRAWPLTDR